MRAGPLKEGLGSPIWRSIWHSEGKQSEGKSSGTGDVISPTGHSFWQQISFVTVSLPCCNHLVIDRHALWQTHACRPDMLWTTSSQILIGPASNLITCYSVVKADISVALLQMRKSACQDSPGSIRDNRVGTFTSNENLLTLCSALTAGAYLTVYIPDSSMLPAEKSYFPLLFHHHPPLCTRLPAWPLMKA